MAWLDRLESRSSVIIWHPLNIISEKEGKLMKTTYSTLLPSPLQWCIYPLLLLRATLPSQGFLLGLGLCVRSWVVKHPLTIPGSLAWLRWEQHWLSGNSCCLAMVKNEIVSHPVTILCKSWPEWNGTIVTRALETLVVTSPDYGQDVKFMHDWKQSSCDPISSGLKWGP